MDEKNSLKIFGENLRVFRAKNNLTQTDFANILGIQNSTLSCYESGERFPSIKIAFLLADKMNTSLDSLFGIKKSEDSIEDILYSLANILKTYNDIFHYTTGGFISVSNQYIATFLKRIQDSLSIYHDGLLDEEMLEACIERAVSEAVNNIKDEDFINE